MVVVIQLLRRATKFILLESMHSKYSFGQHVFLEEKLGALYTFTPAYRKHKTSAKLRYLYLIDQMF